MKEINGVVPVMLTPFNEQNEIDWPGLERLIEWYVQKGVDALFAVCQSSEMQFLSLQERVQLGRFVVEKTAGRVPVIVSGHISDDIDGQREELLAMADTGADALVLVTNHLDPKNQGSEVFYATLQNLLDALPQSLPLGLYECPAPYRRLLTDDEFSWCARSGRFRGTEGRKLRSGHGKTPRGAGRRYAAQHNQCQRRYRLARHAGRFKRLQRGVYQFPS
ncbi:Dihydrodipicolinate synthase [Serratia odorifera]|uniref:Dihydrodipicolinate synthase n=1 Tax=Serratia odorifera TaxID=618 RepID=A0A3S4DLY0_SEROD|nr:Dihydrodipicolinate synthase [Serratia odorifera]